MKNLSSPLNLELFKNFAEHWRKTLGSALTLLSPAGIPLTVNGDAPAIDWLSVIKDASPEAPAYLRYANRQIITVPLVLEGRLVAYLAAVDAHKQDLALLNWAADSMMTRLVEEQALQDMTDELISAWNQLELIYRVTQKLTLTSNLMVSLQSILLEIKRVVNTEYAFILMKRSDSLEYVTCDASLTGGLKSETLLTNLSRSRQVLLGESRYACQQFWPEVPPEVKNLLATSLTVDDTVQAALVLVNKMDKDFTAGDTKLLAALSMQVGVVIKNFLVHEHLISQERLSRELEIAAEIQKSMLPTRLPQVGGLSIAVSSTPASEVGGDFYDFVTVNDRHLTVIIGDVAGKGIPAAMLTSVTRTILRVEAMRGEPPHTIIRQANDVLYQDLSRADSFVTAFVATIDSFEGTLSYASAGHMPVILWRAETRNIELLNATSPPIGITGYQGDDTRTVKINPGDTIILYTDGITDAQAPNGNFFGLNRLLYIIRSRAVDPPEQLQEYIRSEVATFQGDSSSRDDATLLILKMLPRSQLPVPKNISTVVKTIKFTYPADIKYLANIAEEVTASCRQLSALPPGPDAEDFIYLVELAISEICTNVIKHAYAHKRGEIVGYVTLLNNGIQLDFYDRGETFDPDSISRSTIDPHQLAEGGYGLHIVRQIMDVVSYERTPNRENHWHLIKFLPPARP